MGDDKLKFAADGMIHTSQLPVARSSGQKKAPILRDSTYDDAYVCLTCTCDKCSGNAYCFARRRKELESKNGKKD